MLPMEVVVPSLRVSRHNDLNPQECSEAMIMELEAFYGKRLQALDHIMIQKKEGGLSLQQAGQKKSFEEGELVGELVWKVVLPIGSKDRELGKWSPIGRNHSRFTKYFSEMPTDYQALKGSHTKGSSMGSTSRNTFSQCGKCWTLPGKTKVGDGGITNQNRSH